MLRLFMLWNICLMIQRCFTFFYFAFTWFCEAVLLCLPKTHGWFNKEITVSNIQDKEEVGLAYTPEKQKRKEEGEVQNWEEDAKGQPPSHPLSHGLKKKREAHGKEKSNIPEAKVVGKI